MKGRGSLKREIRENPERSQGSREEKTEQGSSKKAEQSGKEKAEQGRKTTPSRFRSVLLVIAGFLGAAIILLTERQGIGVSGSVTETTEAMLTEEALKGVDTDKPVSKEKTCLFLWNSKEATSAQNYDTLIQMLRDMRVPVDEVDVATEKIPSDAELPSYRTVVAAMDDLDALSEDIFVLCNYVEAGGRMLFPYTLSKTHTFNAIASRVGVSGSGDDFKVVHGFLPADGFMIGGDGQEILVEEPYESALNLGVDSESTVYMTDTQDRTPLIWSRSYGEGRFVVCNFGYCGKAYRGIYAAAYSLLEDVCVWPVINASSFYLDDFPSPVPEGDSTWISRDYDLDVAGFYSDVWWPDVMGFMRTYGIKYTGLIIETYSDQVSGALRRNQDTGNYYYYGDMLLNAGGELGFHGYNHQPLCGPDYVYEEDLGYKLWDSAQEMRYAMQELYSFSSAIFPDTDFNVYVPPSNVLSGEARQMIGQGDLPGVRVIASTYLPGGSVYEQEFGVADDGITETPRVISGGVFDDFTKLTAFSELNLHFVNSHFMHPDDLMDPDRGAELGWEELKRRITAYLDWLTASAPSLEETSGSGMAGRVQRFAALCPDKRESTDTGEIIHFTGLQDEGWCLVRVNSGTPGSVSGGSLEHVTGNLYLLHVTAPDVEIAVTGKENGQGNG